jgi:HTH-type transcriptional regulator / antitoxin HigA
MNRKQLLQDERELLSRPGDTITETLEHLKMSQAQLAARMGKTPSKISDIISGKEPITYNTALQLERVLGVDAPFWLNLEVNYREKLARLEQQEQLEKYLDWIRQHPVRELKQRGYIVGGASEVSMVEALLKFYGVVSPAQWSLVYLDNNIKKSYCRSEEGKKGVGSVTTWLRLGELEMQKLDLPEFDRRGFKDAVTTIGNWVMHSPGEVMEEVKAVCAKAGVAVVYESVSKVPAKGAARWVAGNPLIQVCLHSNRKKEEFWHTFYHEVAHVLLHGRKDVFIDDFAGFQPDKDREKEADLFAQKFVLRAGETLEGHD